MAASDRAEDGARGRVRILDAAQRLFARRGFTATPIKAIAAEAGVATGLLYYHFASKEDLLDTLVVERSPAPQVDELIDAGEDGAEPRATLERIAHALLDVLDERRDIARILLQDAAIGEDGGGRLQRLLQAELDGLAGYLHAITRVTRQRAELASRILVTNLLIGTLVLPDTDREQIVQGTVDIVLAALT